MMNIKKYQYLLKSKKLSNCEISEEVGIAQVIFSRFVRKESDIGNMSLDNALKLSEYYNKYFNEIKQRKKL